MEGGEAIYSSSGLPNRFATILWGQGSRLSRAPSLWEQNSQSLRRVSCSPVGGFLILLDTRQQLCHSLVLLHRGPREPQRQHHTTRCQGRFQASSSGSWHQQLGTSKKHGSNHWEEFIIYPHSQLSLPFHTAALEPSRTQEAEGQESCITGHGKFKTDQEKSWSEEAEEQISSPAPKEHCGLQNFS